MKEFEVKQPVASKYRGMYEEHYDAKNFGDDGFAYMDVKRVSVMRALKKEEKLYGDYTILDENGNIVNTVEETDTRAAIAITFSPANPKIGEEVTITTVPSEGVTLSGATISGGKFTPTAAGSVTITATPSEELAAEYKTTTKSVVVAKKDFSFTLSATTGVIGDTITVTTTPADVDCEVKSADGKATVSDKTITLVSAGTATISVVPTDTATYVAPASQTITIAEEVVTITYSTAHGTAPASKTVTKGYALKSSDLPTLTATGWTFNGWDKTAGTVINANTTITASWTEVETDYIYYGPVDADKVSISNSLNEELVQANFSDAEEAIDVLLEEFTKEEVSSTGTNEIEFNLANEKMLFVTKSGKTVSNITHYNVITKDWDNYMSTFEHCTIESSDGDYIVYVCKDHAATINGEKLRVTIGG